MGRQVIKRATRLRGYYQESLSSADTRMAMEQGVGISLSLLFLKTSRAVATSILMTSKSRAGMLLTTLICCSRIYLLQKTTIPYGDITPTVTDILPQLSTLNSKYASGADLNSNNATSLFETETVSPVLRLNKPVT